MYIYIICIFDGCSLTPLAMVGKFRTAGERCFFPANFGSLEEAKWMIVIYTI